MPTLTPDARESAETIEASSGGFLRRLRSFPFHPLLAASFPILALYAGNVGQASAQGIGRLLAMSIAGTAAAWLVLGLLARNVRKGAMAASLLVLMFFSYGHL